MISQSPPSSRPSARRGGVRAVVCLVYDPEQRLVEPGQFEAERQRDEGLVLRCVASPVGKD
jgi:hypothetical protein